jgi:hypothetical protein
VKQDRPLKHFLIPLLLSVLGYSGFYACDAHLRQRHGPWQVTFLTEGATPTLIVEQARMRIHGFRIQFPGAPTAAATLGTARVSFDAPRQTVPFGRLIGDDLMYLPGTVVLDMFGHTIELLPRVLIVDGVEHPWQPARAITVRPHSKAPATQAPPASNR